MTAPIVWCKTPLRAPRIGSPAWSAREISHFQPLISIAQPSDISYAVLRMKPGIQPMTCLSMLISRFSAGTAQPV